MSIEERFNAAVNVIRGLPKNGSYQPSNDMMLKFYSYFKQATIGPCKEKKPAFWDVVNRVKWDSWRSLGDLPKEGAMEKYVEELKKIVETMSYTENVANFMGSVDELNNINLNDLEMIAPEIIKKVLSRPNSPFASREASPIRDSIIMQNGITNIHNLNSNNNNNDSISSEQTQIITNGNGTHENGYVHTNGVHSDDQSDDEYIDTVEDESDIIHKHFTSNHSARTRYRRTNSHTDSNGFFPNRRTDLINDYDDQINRTVDRMNVDLQQLNNRINIIEKSVSDLRSSQLKVQKRYPSWWPFNDISPNWFLFIVIWPFVAHRITNMMQSKRKY